MNVEPISERDEVKKKKSTTKFSESIGPSKEEVVKITLLDPRAQEKCFSHFRRFSSSFAAETKRSNYLQLEFP